MTAPFAALSDVPPPIRTEYFRVTFALPTVNSITPLSTFPLYRALLNTWGQVTRPSGANTRRKDGCIFCARAGPSKEPPQLTESARVGMPLCLISTDA